VSEDQPDRDLADALEWLHKRLEHRFTIDAGMFMLDNTMIRGQEAWFRWEDESRESCEITVYVPAFTVKLDPDDLKAKVADRELLQLRTSLGSLDIHDEGPGGA
jgi:hypothetical protein